MRNFNSIIKYGWHSSFSLVKATLMSVLLFCLCGKFNCRDEYYGCHVSALFVDNVRHFWFGFHCQPFCRYHIVYIWGNFFPVGTQTGSQACTVRCSEYYRQLKAVECLVTCENIEIKLKLQMLKNTSPIHRTGSIPCYTML